MQQLITDDLNLLLASLPPNIGRRIAQMPQRTELIEIVLDLGRPPEIRFPAEELCLAEDVVTEDDLTYVAQHVGAFGDDNRAGIERTLHRISCIRNRRGKIIGLTCRVGRAVFGSVALVRDIIEQGRNVLILGRPGIGKTTLLREIARVLADDFNKRVVIVDTSNEIAGDGDIPHPGIGKARRMQVARPTEQHAVMIEAVENHMPEVIVIDEIGTELEAQAARTIAERGVQLIGTAHGNTLDNLLLNPTLSDLIGGIGSVTLGDEEARRRGTQKTVLERKAPPTFDVVVELHERTRMLIHNSVADTVDALLRGETPSALVRTLQHDKLQTQSVSVVSQRPELAALKTPFYESGRNHHGYDREYAAPRPTRHIHSLYAEVPLQIDSLQEMPQTHRSQHEISIYDESAGEHHAAPVPMVTPKNADGIYRIQAESLNNARILEVARQMDIQVMLVSDREEADAIFMHRSRYIQTDIADAFGDLRIPIFVMNSRNAETVQKVFAQMLGLPIARPELWQEHEQVEHVPPDQEKAPVAASNGNREHSGRKAKAPQVQISGKRGNTHEEARAMQEAEDAIHYILRGKTPSVELTPQRAPVRKLQHMLARRYNVVSRSQGKEPNRRVCMFSA